MDIAVLGCEVRIVGLVDRSDLNGCFGTLLHFDESRWRWAVGIGKRFTAVTAHPGELATCKELPAISVLVRTDNLKLVRMPRGADGKHGHGSAFDVTVTSMSGETVSVTGLRQFYVLRKIMWEVRAALGVPLQGMRLSNGTTLFSEEDAGEMLLTLGVRAGSELSLTRVLAHFGRLVGAAHWSSGHLLPHWNSVAREEVCFPGPTPGELSPTGEPLDWVNAGRPSALFTCCGGTDGARSDPCLGWECGSLAGFAWDSSRRTWHAGDGASAPPPA
mmetsp:Transcript_2296/g.7749  ORF Transcript_2296/g.7749 Transcript_2296/m.7749 type:complete len:274 (-) Transcript_2296:107-928(-)